MKDAHNLKQKKKKKKTKTQPKQTETCRTNSTTTGMTSLLQKSFSKNDTSTRRRSKLQTMPSTRR
jgi:hypothetical protein